MDKSLPAAERPLRILQVSTQEKTGGAAQVAWNLHHIYLKRGIQAYMAVGQKETDDPNVFQVPNDQARSLWTRAFLGAGNLLQPLERRVPGTVLFRKLMRGTADPIRYLDIYRGLEDFRFPGTWRIPDLTPQKPDIIHCHNLHGGYFDLRALPGLSRRLPVVLTLQDAWLLSGHCAHSFDCQGWKTGCGDCPDLTIYPAIRRDATVHNWRRKRDIYSRSRFYVATPCEWLMNKVKESALAQGAVGCRVVPNGVDLSLFRPGDQHKARQVLGLPVKGHVLLFVSHRIRNTPWRDYGLLEEVVSRLSDLMASDWPLVLVCRGEDGESYRLGRAEVRFVPFNDVTEDMVRYYQAADVSVHPAKADTFPNVILEALACGTPVVATAVGGIPEQVDDGITGFLTPAGDAQAMAARVQQLLADEAMRSRFSADAVKSARQRFDLEHQVEAYLAWYNEIVQH